LNILTNLDKKEGKYWLEGPSTDIFLYYFNMKPLQFGYHRLY